MAGSFARARVEQLVQAVSARGFYAEIAQEPHPGWSLTSLPHAEVTARGQNVATKIGADELRVALATWHLGLVSRLWSVAIGAAIEGAHLDLSTLHLAATGDQLAVDTTHVTCRDLGSAPERDVVANVVDTCHHLHDAIRAVSPLATGLLWGNVTSSALNTVRLQGSTFGALSPQAVVDECLARPELANTVKPAPYGWKRLSCCLFYQTPQGGMCGDCSLR